MLLIDGYEEGRSVPAKVIESIGTCRLATQMQIEIFGSYASERESGYFTSNSP